MGRTKNRGSSPGRVLHEADAVDRPFAVSASETLERFAGHWPRSDRLGNATCHIFQCADLIEVWLDTIGKARRTRPVFVGVYDAADRPALLLGLGIELRWGARVLSFLDGTVSDYNQPVVFPAAAAISEAAWSRIWPRILRTIPPFDVAEFDKMPGSIGTLPNPLLHLGAASTAGAGHAMTLPGSLPDLETKLPHRRGRNRLLRQLTTLGPVEFKVASTTTEAEIMLRTVVALKARQYEKSRVPGFDLPGARDFYHAVTRRIPCPGTAHVSALTVGDAVIACHWGLVLEGRFYLLLTAYDERWRRFSPGAHLHDELIRWCHAHGIMSFDFGIGDEAYKADYCDTRVLLHRVQVTLGRTGRAYLAAGRILAWLRATRAWRALRPLKWDIIRGLRR